MTKNTKIGIGLIVVVAVLAITAQLWIYSTSKERTQAIAEAEAFAIKNGYKIAIPTIVAIPCSSCDGRNYSITVVLEDRWSNQLVEVIYAGGKPAMWRKQ